MLQLIDCGVISFLLQNRESLGLKIVGKIRLNRKTEAGSWESENWTVCLTGHG